LIKMSVFAVRYTSRFTLRINEKEKKMVGTWGFEPQTSTASR
jgi:hypothetical protein